ncbi:MAG: NTF2-like N-terminal transpeptidase domain-containing protein [Candidatus Omnitrophota bacterium]
MHVGKSKSDRGTTQTELKTLLFFLTVFLIFAVTAGAGVTVEENMIGIPLDLSEKNVNLDICPAGARVISVFLSAWEKKDNKTMYDLLDEKSKDDYSFKEAKFAFQYLEFKPYKISSVRQKGDDFEFLLSFGDWRYGNKEIKKILIDGMSYGIIMSPQGSPLRESAENSLR